jgi:hypothetical protein
MATHLWYSTRALLSANGLELTSPNYSEIMHPDTKDNRTAADIRNETLHKFKG